MKIIYTLNNFLPQQVAGTEVYVFTLAKEMQSMGHQVIILIPNFEKFVNEKYTYENIQVIQFAEPTIVNRGIIAGKIIPDGLQNFINIVKEIAPDIIHFHTVGGSNGISLHHLRAVKILKLAVVITFHLAGYSCITNNLLYQNKIPCNGLINTLKCTKCVYSVKGLGTIKKNILYQTAVFVKRLNYSTLNWNNSIGTAIGYPFVVQKIKTDLLAMVELADKIIVISQWYKKVLEINGILSKKLYFIPQGLTGQPLTKIIDKKDDILKMVFVGRINESKGVHLLIKAISKIGIEKLSLDIYGPVNDNSYASKWKAFTSASTNIRWMGVIQPVEMVNTLANYHLLCLPSIICEMSPLVIQEAYAAGLPVLASDVYGNAEQIIDGENGWLFKFNDVDDLKNKIEYLLSKPFLINDAGLKIKSVKSFKTIAEEHFSLYVNII